MKKTKQIFFNIALLCITLGIMLLLGEVYVRIFSYGPDESEWIGNPRKFYEYDPLLGWKKVPNMDTVRTSIKGTNKVHYQINSKGIRGPEYSYEKADNEYRILVLGDSYTEGYVVEFDNLFSEVMINRLNKKKERMFFTAINSGTAGWSTDQELLFFQNEGNKYGPNLTVLMFYENDLAYNNQIKDWGMYYKPLYKEENGKLVLTNVPVPRPDRIVHYDQLTTGEESLFKKVRSWLYRRSYLYGFIKERVKNTYFLNNLKIKLGIIEKPGNRVESRLDEEDILPPREFKVWEKKHNESVNESWQITEAMLSKLKEETDVVGSELLVFFVPHEASVYPEVWSRIKTNYGFTDKDWDIDQVGIELEAICKRNGIAFINPTELFKARARELKKTDKIMYHPVDKHWNVEGNEFAGELLADHIALKLLKGRK